LKHQLEGSLQAFSDHVLAMYAQLKDTGLPATARRPGVAELAVFSAWTKEGGTDHPCPPYGPRRSRAATCGATIYARTSHGNPSEESGSSFLFRVPGVAQSADTPPHVDATNDDGSGAAGASGAIALCKPVAAGTAGTASVAAIFSDDVTRYLVKYHGMNTQGQPQRQLPTRSLLHGKTDLVSFLDQLYHCYKNDTGVELRHGRDYQVISVPANQYCMYWIAPGRAHVFFRDTSFVGVVHRLWWEYNRISSVDNEEDSSGEADDEEHGGGGGARKGSVDSGEADDEEHGGRGGGSGAGGGGGGARKGGGGGKKGGGRWRGGGGGGDGGSVGGRGGARGPVMEKDGEEEARVGEEEKCEEREGRLSAVERQKRRLYASPVMGGGGAGTHAEMEEEEEGDGDVFAFPPSRGKRKGRAVVQDGAVHVGSAKKRPGSLPRYEESGRGAGSGSGSSGSGQGGDAGGGGRGGGSVSRGGDTPAGKVCVICGFCVNHS
jgi:hypothetical protein